METNSCISNIGAVSMKFFSDLNTQQSLQPSQLTSRLQSKLDKNLQSINVHLQIKCPSFMSRETNAAANVAQIAIIPSVN